MLRLVPLVLWTALAHAQLIPDALLRAILTEISTENALRHTGDLAARIRYPNSQSFFDAAEAVATQARSYGLKNVRIERFPSDQPLWDPAGRGTGNDRTREGAAL